MNVITTGSRGDDVKRIKEKLYQLGYLKVEPTHNRFGADTLAAVKAFQTQHKLKEDGKVGTKTFAALMSCDGSCAHDVDGVKKNLIEKREMMLDIIEKRVGDEYVWGAQGQIVTAAYIKQRAKDKPKFVTPERAARMIAYAGDHPVKPNGEPLRCEDCSGLFWTAENTVELPLDATKDIDDSTAKGLYTVYCTPVSRAKLQPLDLVFSGDPISHVGIVGRDGRIYEAAGSEIGVVVNKDVDTRILTSIYGSAYKCAERYVKGKWTKFGRLKIYAAYGI